MIRPKANEMPSRSAPVMAGFESPASTKAATTDPGPTNTSRAVPSTSANARCGSECSITPPISTCVRHYRTRFRDCNPVQSPCQPFGPVVEERLEEVLVAELGERGVVLGDPVEAH